MLLIHCPWCGPRAEIEFSYAGPAHLRRDGALEDLLYLRDNPKGRHEERWCHAHGCGQFFATARDTVSDFFLPPAEPQP
jgi:sarcosine oxidase subunit delta